MIRIEFTAEEIEQLHHERRYHPHPRVRQRMEALYLKALGYPHQQIGRILRIDQKTLCRYLCLYLAGGIEALKALNFYQPVSDLQAHRELLREEFEAHPAKTINEAVKRIETLTGFGAARPKCANSFRVWASNGSKSARFRPKQTRMSKRPLWKKSSSLDWQKRNKANGICSSSMPLIA